MAMQPGICHKKPEFIKKMRRFEANGFSGAALFTSLPEPPSADAEMETVSAWLVDQKLYLSLVEVQNLYHHFPAPGGKCDLAAFIEACANDNSGRDPVWLTPLGENDNAAHLALSGTSSMLFGQQHKAFPAHWGKPPNAQMKGHSGIMRELPGAYGKGNEPMAKWVKKNMDKDKESKTTIRGDKPFPLGNYSL